MKTAYGSPEAAVLRNYLDICLEIPFGKFTKDRLDINRAKKILDADHDGLEKPKNRILEYLAVKQLNPQLRHQIICFVGPPGVGKTSLGQSIARAMNRKFVRVSLAGYGMKRKSADTAKPMWLPCPAGSSTVYVRPDP